MKSIDGMVLPICAHAAVNRGYCFVAPQTQYLLHNSKSTQAERFQGNRTKKPFGPMYFLCKRYVFIL